MTIFPMKSQSAYLTHHTHVAATFLAHPPLAQRKYSGQTDALTPVTAGTHLTPD